MNDCKRKKMSNGRLSSHFTLPSEEKLKELIGTTKDWALLNGIVMRSKSNYSRDSVIFAPFTLFPSIFPRVEFEKAVEIQPVLNELMHKVAHDYEFLYNTLKNTIEVDHFTKKLFEIYEIVRKEGFTQSFGLGIFRSDYMIDVKNEISLSIRQVEINTIASSFAGLSSKLSLLHRFVLERLNRFEDLKKLPENNALSGICEGLLEAWRFYDNKSAAILIVVEDMPFNIADQRFHEFELYKLNPNIRILRETLTELSVHAKLDEQRRLLVNGEEIAVVYYRSGYSPEQYPSEKEWDIRLQIERSKAIKCPTINYHLAGTKRVQQALAVDEVLDKFLKDEEKNKKVKGIFTGLYSLDLNAAGDEAVEMAVKNPDDFVLKPQREGGGNNVYGDDIPKLLSEIGKSKERTAFILMNRIRPPVQNNFIIKPGDNDIPSNLDVISELGIFGVIIGNEKNIIVNKQVGHMLRTKEHSINEGGVAFGAGSLDSPFLSD
ncbi:glutathione synthetase-like isoform X2 [Planococcus citri]|uniref:glutathione synthetase-like isoform X2 n=1 Tax=Planococcus citri TaxID=170843 RepID=UPI0031F751B0